MDNKMYIVTQKEKYETMVKIGRLYKRYYTTKILLKRGKNEKI